MKIKALIFDLDDTLYDEKQFVKSGFRTASKCVATNYGINEEILYNTLLNTFFDRGREKVFDTALKTLNIYKKRIVLEMLNAYRNHLPNITLFSDAQEILPQVRREYRTALFTDGLKEVQENKVKALKIGNFFDVITYAVEYGGKNIQAFSTTLERLKAEPSESIYIDDNPMKAFAVAKKLGIHIVQILRGENKNLKVTDEQCRPQFEILNLQQLSDVIRSI